MNRFAALLLMTLLLPACGQSGDLYRPDPLEESRPASEAPQPRSDADDFEDALERQEQDGATESAAETEY